MRVLSLVCALAVGACGSSPLPSLPEVRDDAPGSLTWVSLTTAVGAEPVEPDAVVAGQALRLVLEVRSVAAQPLAGVEAVFSVQAENFADLIRFPQGDRCLSDAQGQCSVVLVSRGGAGAFDLTARIVADPPVVETYPFVVVAEQESAHVTLDIETLGTLEWASGQGTRSRSPIACCFWTWINPLVVCCGCACSTVLITRSAGATSRLRWCKTSRPQPMPDHRLTQALSIPARRAIPALWIQDCLPTPALRLMQRLAMLARAMQQTATAARIKCSRSRSTPSRCV